MDIILSRWNWGKKSLHYFFSTIIEEMEINFFKRGIYFNIFVYRQFVDYYESIVKDQNC